MRSNSGEGVRYAAILIAVVLLVRGLSLGVLDFMEPTEGRYANIALEMLKSGDWMTPHVWIYDQLVPYYSKPPLHFWFTAISYSLFGVDEWVARIPSFIGFLVILFCIYKMAYRFFDMEVALGSILIFVSSVIVYALSGASVVDVTLTAFLVLSLSCLFLAVEAEGKRSRSLYRFSSFFLALGFMTKGPLALALFGMTAMFLVWRFGIKRLCSTVPWISSILVFLAVAAPWFVLEQMRNPEFLPYYLLRENMGRYLTNSFGSRYGSGHHYRLGSSWLMLLGAFAPWSFFLVSFPLSGRFRALFFRNSSRCEWFSVFLFSGLCPPILFTFSRNLLGTYMIYGIPFLSIALSFVFKSLMSSRMERLLHRLSGILLVFVLLGLGIVFLTASPKSGALIALSSSGLFVLWFVFSKGYRGVSGPSAAFCNFAFVVTILYSSIIFGIGDYINLRRSSEPILAYVSAHKGDSERVFVLTRYNQTPRWIASAWKGELSAKMEISQLRFEEMLKKRPKHIVLKESTRKRELSRLEKLYGFRARVGRWSWLERRDIAE